MRRLHLAAVAVLLTLFSVPNAFADVVTDWNLRTVNAIRTAGIGPNPASRALAITHIAIHDALVAISKAYRPYKSDLVVAGPASRDAAAATAAHKVLENLFPGQKTALDQALQTALAAIPDGPEKVNGINLGDAAADEILNLRSLDGASVVEAPFTGSTDVGKWRPTPRQSPDAGAPLPMADPQWRNVTPFALSAPNQYRVAVPPGLTSAQYLADFAEVKSLGDINSATRTADQTVIAKFWVQATHIPINEIARTLSAQKGLSVDQNGYLFAVLNIALADSRIAIWDSKYFYDAWRPITAINLGDPEDAGTAPDPTWAPLIETPNHPEYPSGHSGTGAAGIKVLSTVFGDTVSFVVNSDSLAGTTRSFTKLGDVAIENGLSRIYGGIHFQYANTASQDLGAKIGQWVLDHELLPLATDAGTANDGGSDASDGGGASEGGTADANADATPSDAAVVDATDGAKEASAGDASPDVSTPEDAAEDAAVDSNGADAGVQPDAGAQPDASTQSSDDSSCSCRLGRRSETMSPFAALGLVLGLAAYRKRRAGHRG